MRFKEAQNILMNALRQSASSPYPLDELIAAEAAKRQSPPENHVDTTDDKKLRGLLNLTIPVERYSIKAPGEIIIRLEQELDFIIENGHSRAYILAYEVVNECKRLFGSYMTTGTAGSSLAAFLLGITHTNPLPPHFYCLACGLADFDIDKYYGGKKASYRCGFDLVNMTCPDCGDELEGDGHDIPFEIFEKLNGEKAPCFQINVPEELYDEINGFLQGLLREEELKQPESNRPVRVISDPIMSLFYKLQDQTIVSEDCISFDGVDFKKAFARGRHKLVPPLENIPRELIDEVSPSCFSDIVKLLGLYHGTAKTDPDEHISDLLQRVYETESAIKIFKLMWYQQNFSKEYNRAISEYREALELKKSD